MEKTINLTVNGREYELPAIPGETLADLLRQRLFLTGTKVGCNEAECGACTVIVDSVPVMSCIYPAERADGRSVLTIEGLAKNGRLHAIQEAFISHGAVQCGFCTPGQIMVAYALLQKNPEPKREEIRYALKDTLCRCAGYPAIESAIYAAARSMKLGEPVESTLVQESSTAFDVIGHQELRPDAREKVTGEAIFTDDLRFEGMLYAAVKRAGVPHAIVKGIKLDDARAMEGVRAILTASDIPGEHNHGIVTFDWPSLVGIGERVRYVGDAVAIVAAETQEIASNAIENILVEYEELPVVSDPVQANLPEAPSLHDGGNLLKHIKVRKGDINQGFSEADVVLEHVFHTPIMEHAFMEPECSVAVPTADGRMEIYVGSQIPYADRNQVARTLGWPDERVRVIGQHMGGSFGGKEDIAGQIHAALLANATQRPVKLLFDRHESFMVHPKRHATQIRVKVGAKKSGVLTAVETELFGDTGAYASLGEKVMTRATTHSTGPYDVPHVRADCYAMYTNNPPAGAFRGFGVTQSAFAMESMMDILADKLGLDRVDLRRKNALRVGSITNTGQILRDSVGLLECIDKVEEEILRLIHEERPGWSPFTSYPVPGAEHLRKAWGLAVGFKNTGLGGGAPDKSEADVELYPDGGLEVRTSAAESGQGLVTVLRMIAAQELSVPLERVRLLVMDTDLTPDGGPTTASRQTYVTGNAVRHAALTLKQAITSFLAEKFDLAPERINFTNSAVQVGERLIPLSEVCSEMNVSGFQTRSRYEYSAPVTTPLGQGGDMHFAYSYGVQAAEVQVNSRTGEVAVLRLVAAHDVGTVINPLGLKGQVEGGMMMGLGNTLTEHFIVEEGRIITDRMARYRIPSIVHTPEITSFVVEHPTNDGPYGAKGVGEIVSVPTIPAITNGIYNAVGVRVDSIPVDQEKLLWELGRSPMFLSR